MKFLQELLLESTTKTANRIKNLNEHVISHANALYNLIEMMDENVDDGSIDKASEVLEMIGRALELTNSTTDETERNEQIARINELLSSVREMITDLADIGVSPDKTPLIPEENEEFGNSSTADSLDVETNNGASELDDLLLRIEQLISGDESGSGDDAQHMDDLDQDGEEGDFGYSAQRVPEENEEGIRSFKNAGPNSRLDSRADNSGIVDYWKVIMTKKIEEHPLLGQIPTLQKKYKRMIDNTTVDNMRQVERELASDLGIDNKHPINGTDKTDKYTDQVDKFNEPRLGQKTSFRSAIQNRQQ